MASWKKLLVSGSDIQVGAITATGVLAIPGFNNVSASLAGALAGGDNLGNHTATQDINLDGSSLTNILNASASGFISASEFIGDGSKLTGISSTLSIAGTTGTDNVDLTTDTFTFAGSNGVTAAVTNNTVTVDTPQDLQSSASPAFAGLDVNGAATVSGNITLDGAGNQTITNSAGNLTIASTNGNVTVDGVTMAGGTVSGTSVTTTGDITVGGDLTVNGTTTTINTANLLVEDKFILLASGSTSATDGGIVVQSAAGGAGFALGYDATADRWVLQDSTPDGVGNAEFGLDESQANTGAYVGTVEVGTEEPGVAVPTYGGNTYGHGTIFINENTEEIYIYS